MVSCCLVLYLPVTLFRACFYLLLEPGCLGMYYQICGPASQVLPGPDPTGTGVY